MLHDHDCGTALDARVAVENDVIKATIDEMGDGSVAREKTTSGTASESDDLKISLYKFGIAKIGNLTKWLLDDSRLGENGAWLRPEKNDDAIDEEKHIIANNLRGAVADLPEDGKSVVRNEIRKAIEAYGLTHQYRRETLGLQVCSAVQMRAAEIRASYEEDASAVSAEYRTTCLLEALGKLDDITTGRPSVLEEAITTAVLRFVRTERFHQCEVTLLHLAAWFAPVEIVEKVWRFTRDVDMRHGTHLVDKGWFPSPTMLCCRRTRKVMTIQRQSAAHVVQTWRADSRETAPSELSKHIASM